MSFDRYVEYALDVPMYFIYRDGNYIDVAGASFRDFQAGRLAAKLGRPELKALEPTMADWSDHIEMRGADAGRTAEIAALPALWVGLLYDQTALDAAWDVVKGWTAEERDVLRNGVPRTGLATPFRRMKLLDIAREVGAIANEGLKARGIKNAKGHDERIHLAAVDAVLDAGRTPAEAMLEAYDRRWGRNIDMAFRELAF
jgi:glutamate--cysteine ligase